MKTKIICRTLIDIRKRIIELCKEYGVEADWVFLPETFGRTNNWVLLMPFKDETRKTRL